MDRIKHHTEDSENVFHDFSKTFWVYLFSKIDPGLEIAVLKFHDFSGFFVTNPECDDQVRFEFGYLNQRKI